MTQREDAATLARLGPEGTPAGTPEVAREGAGKPGRGKAGIHVPASMMRYMTFELAQALSELSQQQVQGIFRIVEAGHLVDDPPAPYSLIRGQNPICSESVWKKAGKQGPDGTWLERPGWSHQPEFLTALKMAKRLVRQQVTQARLNGMERGVGLLQTGMAQVAQRLLGLATGYEVNEQGERVLDAAGKPVPIEVDVKDQIAAGKTVLSVALEQAALAREQAAAENPLAQAWWEVADEENRGQTPGSQA